MPQQAQAADPFARYVVWAPPAPEPAASSQTAAPAASETGQDRIKRRYAAMQDWMQHNPGTVGAVSAGIAAAPFTGGLSIPATMAAEGAAAGAGTAAGNYLGGKPQDTSETVTNAAVSAAGVPVVRGAMALVPIVARVIRGVPAAVMREAAEHGATMAADAILPGSGSAIRTARMAQRGVEAVRDLVGDAATDATAQSPLGPYRGSGTRPAAPPTPTPPPVADTPVPPKTNAPKVEPTPESAHGRPRAQATPTPPAAADTAVPPKTNAPASEPTPETAHGRPRAPATQTPTAQPETAKPSRPYFLKSEAQMADEAAALQRMAAKGQAPPYFMLKPEPAHAPTSASAGSETAAGRFANRYGVTPEAAVERILASPELKSVPKANIIQAVLNDRSIDMATRTAIINRLAKMP